MTESMLKSEIILVLLHRLISISTPFT